MVADPRSLKSLVFLNPHPHSIFLGQKVTLAAFYAFLPKPLSWSGLNFGLPRIIQMWPNEMASEFFFFEPKPYQQRPIKRLNATQMTSFLHKGWMLQLMFKGRVPFPAQGWWGQQLRTSPPGSVYPPPPGVHWWGTVIKRQTFKKYTKSAPTHPLGSSGLSLTQTTRTPLPSGGGHGRKQGGAMAECHVSTCRPATCDEALGWTLFSVPLLHRTAQPQRGKRNIYKKKKWRSIKRRLWGFWPAGRFIILNIQRSTVSSSFLTIGQLDFFLRGSKLMWWKETHWHWGSGF